MKKRILLVTLVLMVGCDEKNQDPNQNGRRRPGTGSEKACSVQFEATTPKEIAVQASRVKTKCALTDEEFEKYYVFE